MIGSSLTPNNLERIYKAMRHIKPIDRSDNFNKYLKELEWRMEAIKTVNQ